MAHCLFFRRALTLDISHADLDTWTSDKPRFNNREAESFSGSTESAGNRRFPFYLGTELDLAELDKSKKKTSEPLGLTLGNIS